MTPHSRIHNSPKRSGRPQSKHLFYKITSLDMIRLYLTLKDIDKDKKYRALPQAWNKLRGCHYPRRFTPHSCSCLSRTPWRSASMAAVLQSQRTFPYPGSCTQHPNPCAETLVHTQVLVLQIIDLCLEPINFFF